jgi:type IV secretion system protein VirD4
MQKMLNSCPYCISGRTLVRRIISAVIQVSVLIDGYAASLGHVLQVLNDRSTLLQHLQWVAGRLKDKEGNSLPSMPIEECAWVSKHSPDALKNYVDYIRGLCSGLADMIEQGSKTFESFITGAQEALTPYNVTCLAHYKTQRSTFRFGELKDGKKPTTVFIMLDANKARAQAPVMGLIQWAMLYELKKHPNKHVPVYLIADEATNIPWSGLGSLMTWARGYGLRLHFIFQTFHAFREAHGENTLQILLSECEIVQVLAGQRNPETLKMLETMLAEESLVTLSHTNNIHQGLGINSANTSEVGRALMTADEIRRTDKTILFIRNNKPLLVDLPSIAAIAPWRTEIGINPFHGKPYLKPVKLNLGRRKG